MRDGDIAVCEECGEECEVGWDGEVVGGYVVCSTCAALDRFEEQELLRGRAEDEVRTRGNERRFVPEIRLG